MTGSGRRSIARHSSYNDTLDDFPTPPWATRAFFEHVAPELVTEKLVFLEPACGRGHMVRTIREYGFRVLAYDIRRYGGHHKIADYTDRNEQLPACDVWMTNPPFKYANEFVERGLDEARRGVALLVRTLWKEGGKENNPRSRWNRILKHNPPTRTAIISARMPAAKGRVIQHYPVFFSHSWLWWDKHKKTKHGQTREIWIPPEAQRLLELPRDYR